MDETQFGNLLAAYNQALRFNKIRNYFPDFDHPGFPARNRYPKHMQFFEDGKKFFSRFACASIGSGKTEGMGGYETTLHLTGNYPKWWTGHRFNRPIDAWIAGETKETTRDIQQTKLFGKNDEIGTGLIPKDCILEINYRRDSNRSIDTAVIKHVSGGKSRIGFKSYDQGVSNFFGTEKDWVWFDELVPLDIYSQGIARTRNREGARAILTFTPLKGRTPIVKMFLEEEDPSRSVTFCSWDEVPHLTEEWKRNALANTPPYLRESVSLGIPTRGAGAVYPVDEAKLVIDPIKIPDHFYRVYGFDGGYHNTAVAFLAWDRENDIVYLTAEYKAGEVDISVHAGRLKMRLQAMKQVSMPGVGDYSGSDVSTGAKILDLYKAQGLRIQPANKVGRDTGIQNIYERMETGRFKVFKTCTMFLQELRTYAYDEKTLQIIKKDDHLLDAVRYAVTSGLALAEPPRQEKYRQKTEEMTFGIYT